MISAIRHSSRIPLPPIPEMVVLSRQTYGVKSPTALPRGVDVKLYVSTYNQAMAHFDTSNWELAEVSLRKAIGLWPSSDLMILLGYTFYFRSDFKGALPFFLEAAHKDPSHLPAQFSLALTWKRLGENERAIDAIQRVLQSDSKNPDAYFLLGYLYQQLEKWDHAETAYKEATKLRRDFVEAYEYLAFMYFYLGAQDKARQQQLYQQAIATYIDLINSNPFAWAFQINIGYIHEQLHEFVEANNAYRNVVETALVAANTDQFIDLGLQFLDVARYKEARTMFHESLKRLKPKQGRSEVVRVLTWIGTAALRLHESRGSKIDETLLDEAERAFSEALSIDPHYIHAQLGLGAVYYAQGRSDEAIRIFKTSVESHPENQSAHANLLFLLDQKVQQTLIKQGLLKKLQEPVHDLEQYRHRKSIEIKGRPISETLIEERR